MRKTDKSNSRVDEQSGAETGGIADPAAVSRKSARARELEQKRLNGLRQLMRTEEGRAWMWGLLGECQIYSSCFTGNSETFYREGMRAVGLPILLQITNEFPDEYLAMTKEANANG